MFPFPAFPLLLLAQTKTSNMEELPLGASCNQQGWATEQQNATKCGCSVCAWHTQGLHLPLSQLSHLLKPLYSAAWNEIKTKKLLSFEDSFGYYSIRS